MSGSIPACAGEPTADAAAPHSPRVYPRVCGGTQPVARQEPTPEGLSPRVRGNRRPPGPQHPALRSIPACAGEPFISGAR